MFNNCAKKIFLDPPSQHYYNNSFFDLNNSFLNRDGSLEPYARVCQELIRRGFDVNTADYLLNGTEGGGDAQYYSFGILSNYTKIQKYKNINLSGFILMEPPVVSKPMYDALPLLTKSFERVFVHNTEGDGYSLKDTDQNKLIKFYWPQPYDDVLPQYWENQERKRGVVVINGNHCPKYREKELYSERIKAMVELMPFGAIELYGRGWDRWWSRNSMWWSYWSNFSQLNKIYKGPCESKFPILSQYMFCLCFENMSMKGYITEKIFDCFYSGTIPIYLGAPDIEKYIPAEAFIDARKYKSRELLWEFLKNLSLNEVAKYREAGRDFINSQMGRKFTYSLEKIMSKHLNATH